MSTFDDLPTEIHINLLEHVAASSPVTLRNLISVSKIHAALFTRYSQALLKAATESALPEHPEFVAGVLQAVFSNHTMILDIEAEKGQELKSWIVETPELDIWSSEFTGDRLKALDFLVDLELQINIIKV